MYRNIVVLATPTNNRYLQDLVSGIEWDIAQETDLIKLIEALHEGHDTDHYAGAMNNLMRDVRRY